MADLAHFSPCYSSAGFSHRLRAHMDCGGSAGLAHNVASWHNNYHAWQLELRYSDGMKGGKLGTEDSG